MATLALSAVVRADAPPGVRFRDARLYVRARQALEQNIVRLPSGRYLRAGRYQFGSLWSRDFAFASRGLLRLGHGEVVRQHLDRLITAARPADALIPRTLDSMPPQLRVFLGAVQSRVPFLRRRQLGLRDPLRPQHVDEHGSISIDSNLLVLRAALDYVRRTGDRAWWRRVEPRLVKIYRFYDRHLRDGLIEQPAYSDWQDSVRRSGRTFYTNLLYYVVSRDLRRHPSFAVDSAKLAGLRCRLEREFRDPATGLYRSVAGRDPISLDGNLLALDWGYLAPESRAGRRLFRALQGHELWKRNGGLPGFNTTPEYPRSWPHLVSRLAGLTHYHDRLYWSWLMALSAKVAHRMGDRQTSERVLARLARNVRRDRTVMEVYRPRAPFKPWRTPLYSSERSFSWGAGFIVDALLATGRVSPPRVLSSQP